MESHAQKPGAEAYLAHIAPDGRTQSVESHLQGVAELAERFAAVFDAAPFGRLAGMAHDIGKYSAGFQQRLHGGAKVDHSTAGALECAALARSLTAACVAGHHAGLPDFGNLQADPPGAETLVGRIKKLLPQRGEAYPGWGGDLPATPAEPRFANDFIRSLWTRMLFSCLVDADFLDTETFMKDGAVCRCGGDDIPKLAARLDAFLARWEKPDTALNRLRDGVQQDCIRSAHLPGGLFSLTVPTGGGKTIASLLFALHHAAENGLARVIFVVPYTSVIEQNAAVFRDILGEENVLEHHAQADFGETDGTGQDARALAAENWDAPVVVTTAVQFFDSLYANRVSRCRKLHHIAGSVVIFDEAQMLPAAHLLPCAAAIGTLVSAMHVSAVLCTATQPALYDLISRYAPGMPLREICSDPPALYNALRRVTYRTAGILTTEALAQKLSAHEQVLCIVNTRKQASALFALLEGEGCFHLSTLMYPRHRQATLAQIRARISAGLPCRVVSTSLVECGVDLDFPTVFREMNGLDSIVQAAGRCNREGKRPPQDCIVTVFESEQSAPPLMRVHIGAAREALAGGDPGDPDTIRRYFSAFRALTGSGIDKTQTVRRLTDGISGCALPFKTVASEFRLIEDAAKTIYISCGESLPLIGRIASGSADRDVYRKAGAYSVQVYDAHYRALCASGDAVELLPGSAQLIHEALYHPQTGLSLQADPGKALFI